MTIDFTPEQKRIHELEKQIEEAQDHPVKSREVAKILDDKFNLSVPKWGLGVLLLLGGATTYGTSYISSSHGVEVGVDAQTRRTNETGAVLAQKIEALTEQDKASTASIIEAVHRIEVRHDEDVQTTRGLLQAHIELDGHPAGMERMRSMERDIIRTEVGLRDLEGRLRITEDAHRGER